MTDIKVRVRFAAEYTISGDPERRQQIYGTSDVQSCIEIDMSNDPGILFGELLDDPRFVDFELVP